MRRSVALLLALLALTASASGAAARDRGGVPPFPKLPGKWSHAEINVRIKRDYHTLILDNGRIVQVSPVQMTLRERDGSQVTIPLSPQTLVVIHGVPATAADLERKMNVQAMRIDGGAAVRVRATS